VSCCGGQRGLEPSVEPEPRVVPWKVVPWKHVALGAAFAGNAMVFSLTANVAEMPARLRLGLHAVLAVLTVGVVALVGRPLAAALRESVRGRRVTFDALFAASIAGAFGTSLLGMMSGGPVYFEVVAILATLHAVGHHVNARGRRRILNALEETTRSIERVEVRTPSGLAWRDVGGLRVGDEVVLHPGRRSPVDGVVVRGRAFVRESELTGEPFAAARRPGDALAAGAAVIDGTLEVRVSAAPGHGSLDRLAAAVRAALTRRGRLQHLADRLAARLVPLVALVAACTFAYWTWRADALEGVRAAMAVLLVACPCAMGFATPLAFWNAIALCARRGVVVRGGETVQRLAEVEHVVFDKTGTLTDVRHTDVEVFATPGTDRVALIDALAALERASDHPVGRAVAELCPSPSARFELVHMRYRPGRGVDAELRDRRDDRRMTVRLDAAAPLEPALRALVPAARASYAHAISIQVDRRPAGVLCVDERPVAGVDEALDALAALGLSVELLTGDAPARAARLAIADTGARLDPHEKEARILERQARGQRVLFVGDGINDAPSMARAHASVAVRDGAPIATELADGTWDGADPRALPFALEVSRAAVASVRASLAYALVYNLVGVAVAAAGLLHPVLAAVLMTASSLLVTWRAGSALEGLGGSDDDVAPRPAPPMRARAVA
jgi:Cu+-exporting ATPase